MSDRDSDRRTVADFGAALTTFSGTNADVHSGVYACPCHLPGNFHSVMRLRIPVPVFDESVRGEFFPHHESGLWLLQCCARTCDFRTALYAELGVKIYRIRRRHSELSDWYLGSLADDAVWQALIAVREKPHRIRIIKQALSEEQSQLELFTRTASLQAMRTRYRALFVHLLNNPHLIDEGVVQSRPVLPSDDRELYIDAAE